MSSDESLNPPPEPKVGYVTRRGTIYKVQGGEALPQKTPDERRGESLRQLGFMALRMGFSRRRHLDRLEADRQRALTTIREARKVSGQVIAQVGDTAVEMTPDQAQALEQHLENVGAKLVVLQNGTSRKTDLSSDGVNPAVQNCWPGSVVQ